MKAPFGFFHLSAAYRVNIILVILIPCYFNLLCLIKQNVCLIWLVCYDIIIDREFNAFKCLKILNEKRQQSNKNIIDDRACHIKMSEQLGIGVANLDKIDLVEIDMES